MRQRLAMLSAILVAVLPGVLMAPLSAGQSATPKALPPISYVCVMAGDEAVLEDKPGRCPNPKCGMPLVPVRLDSKFWCPTHQTLVVRDGPGKCPLDQKDLVQVTLSEFWTCPDKPMDHLLEPGLCSNGQPRKISHEVRAHGDHNPRHDGQFFMAEDQWHHIEGALPAAGTFRMFFYDNFTKPISPKGFTARISRDVNGRTESIPMTLSRDGRTLQARLTPSVDPTKAVPVQVKAWVKFSKDTKENLFDFGFDRLSVEPTPAPPAAPRTTSTRPPASAAPATASPAPPEPPAVAAAAQAQPPAAQQPRILDQPLQIPPGLADALDETKLPADTPGLLAELSTRAAEVESLVNAGNLSQVFLPAIGTKTVALALDSSARSLPAQQRALVSASVKRIVTAAWELDAYGDLGNRRKIMDAHQRFASAVTDLKAAYAAR